TLSFALLLEGITSKFVPAMVTAVPTVPMTGVKPVIVGAAGLSTVKVVLLVAEPVGVVTLIAPVVAPDGTVVKSFVTVAEVTVAATPLKVTVFWLGVVLKPVP